MFGVEETRRRSGRRIFVASSLVCAVFAGMAGWAFRLSTEMVGPAAAQSGRSEPKARVSMLPHSMLPPAPSLADVPPGAAKMLPSSTGPGVSSAANGGAAPPVQPTLISHAQPQSVPAEPAATEQAFSESAADLDEWAGYEPWTPGRDDTFRTVCVRLCDGAYFPVSFSTTPGAVRQRGCSS
jgi:hypothetical protein